MIFPGRKIAHTRVADREISTVELPRFPGDPVRFETCIFNDNGDSNVVAQWNTEAEAQAKHNWIVQHERRHDVAKRHFFESKKSEKVL